jgi:slime mold repeat-containing protein
MAQDRGSRRGVTSWVSCAVVLLFGMLAFAAGCSSTEGGSVPELIETSSEAQIIGDECDVNCSNLNNSCATFACDLTTGTCKASKVLLKEGAACTGRDVIPAQTCHLNLCCPGCVIVGKRATPVCAPRGGVEDMRCGGNGENCADCTADTCQQGACVKQACELKPVADGDPCTKGGGACNKGICCKGCLDANGACQPGGALEACGVSSGKLATCQDCTEKVPVCTDAACVSGECSYPAVAPGTSCADTNVCNGSEECSGTSCSPGKPLDCDDGKACTKDSCDGAKGCIHTALTGDDCSDGDACTTNDTCGSDGECKPGTQINCDDGEFCTVDKCMAGNCVKTPKATTVTCDDGNACTAGDMCTSAGKCAGTNPNLDFTCDDNNPCTVDVQPNCAVKQCTHTPAPDTVACPADACHQNGHCSGVDDTCVAGDAKDCSDNTVCTKDSCDPTTGCEYANDASADCSDGDPCTDNDVCVAGNCGGKPKKCLALDACHDAGTCNATTGKCDDPRADDGIACPGGACESGTCILDPNIGVGGEGAGGAAVADGGEPSIGLGGAGPSTPVGEAGEGQTPGNNGEAGAPPVVEEPTRPFVRNPAGCSCEVPNGGHDRPMLLIGLALWAGAAGRRSRRGRAAA